MRGVYLGDLTWPEAKAWIDAGRVIVVPIGAAAKEHGYHLPLKTDYMLAEALSRGVADALPVVIAPVIGFGYYPAFRHYPGSQHVSPETFSALLRDILSGFIAQGASRIAVINTGVSTEPVVHVALRELYEETGIRVQVADIRRLGKDTDHLMQQSSGGHADEHETSIIMAIDASVVRLDRAVADYGNTGALPKTVYYAPTVFSGDAASGPDYSVRGARGDPTLATAEKGRAMLDASIRDLVDGLRTLFPEAMSE
jgi:creatinine amidohydrolase